MAQLLDEIAWWREQRERRLLQPEPFSCLCPWHSLNESDQFDMSVQWLPVSAVATGRVIAFARRQDNDDVAGVELGTGRVVCVNGWTSEGCIVQEVHADGWAWLHRVADDMREVWLASQD